MEVEAITAQHYLELMKEALANGASKKAFSELKMMIQSRPATCVRLGMELIDVLWRTLEKGVSPGPLAAHTLSFSGFISGPYLPEYINQLERITLRSFTLLRNSRTSTGDTHALELTLGNALLTLKKLNPGRFQLMMQGLKHEVTSNDVNLENLIKKFSGFH